MGFISEIIAVEPEFSDKPILLTMTFAPQVKKTRRMCKKEKIM